MWLAVRHRGDVTGVDASLVFSMEDNQKEETNVNVIFGVRV